MRTISTGGNKSRIWWVALGALGLALFGLLVWLDTGRQDQPPAAGQIRAFDLVSRQFAFQPNEIRVQQGDVVRLLVTSADVMHGLGIEEYGIFRQTPPGETTVIEFTAHTTGSFRMYCTVFCGTGHPDHRATLIVEEE